MRIAAPEKRKKEIVLVLLQFFECVSGTLSRKALPFNERQFFTNVVSFKRLKTTEGNFDLL